MKQFLIAVRIMVFFTILCGVAYPLAMTGLSQVLFSEKANGSLVYKNDQPVGSALIGQNFEKLQYFWSRPSAIGYNPQPSGGSNLGQVSADLKKVVDERTAKLKESHATTEEPPQDLIFASASGLDPHISPEAARYQIKRVAAARNIDAAQIEKMVAANTQSEQWGIFGKPRVNVVLLNMALDNLKE